MLVTNSLNFLPQVDRVIMIEDNKIVAIGAYKELIKKNEYFIKFVNNSLNNSRKENSINEGNYSCKILILF